MPTLKDIGTLNLLNALIWGEARGEPIHGKIAVAWVVRNRLTDPRWPDSYEDVILQPLQFSCFNNPKNHDFLIHHYWDDIAWRECRYAAEGVLDDWVGDVTKGANHYHTISIPKVPNWANQDKVTTIIENHIFYRL